MSTMRHIVGEGRLLEGSFTNSANGRYFNLHWGKAKWRLEEMADGSAIPSMRAFGDKLDLVAYELPVLDRALKNVIGQMGHLFSLDAGLVKTYAKVKADDSGAMAREKIVAANEAILQDIIAQARADGRHEDAEKVLRALPDFRKKLVWKRVP